MEAGWVYVLVNSSVPGMAKVGRTTRAPAERAAELSSTGVATPFIVAYQLHLPDCHAGERAIHAELDRRGLRVAPNREFFRGAASEIIDVVLQAGEALGTAKPPEPATLRHGETAAAILAAGDHALHGTGDTLQDTGEALRCYKLAIARGSAEACERVGSIFVQLYATRKTKAFRKRALSALKEGARRGNALCYPALAELFALDNHRANFEKAWRLFFAAIPAGADLAETCCRYIAQCRSIGLVPAHRTELRAAAEPILACLLSRLNTAPNHRQQTTDLLRWAYAELLPNTPNESALKRTKVFWSFFSKKDCFPTLI